MAYKGKRAKKKPIYKRLGFWMAIITLVLIAVLVGWTVNMFSNGDFTVRQPDPTTEPTSMTRPPQETEATIPPPEANPYGPADFMLKEETQEMIFLSGETIKGIDVSTWQGKIDWQKVKDSGVEFVMIRVGGRGTDSGALYEDDMCRKYYDGAKAVGLKVGAYFFSQSLTIEEAVEEAEFVLDMVKDWEVDMPLVYDWEYIGDGARTDHMNARLLTAPEY